MAARYAVYYAPAPADPLWSFGCGVIGYDAATGADVPLLPPDGFTARAWLDATAEPRRYGFHATLKAPFELTDGCSVDDLKRALAELADRLPAAEVLLDVGRIGRFVALVPSGDAPGLADWALSIVEALESIRAPLSAADRARRLKGGGLSPRQIELLDRYGYPYVAEQFRFHMTLTGPLDEAEGTGAAEALRARYRAEVPAGPRRLDRLVLFMQATRDDRFKVLDSFTIR